LIPEVGNIGRKEGLWSEWPWEWVWPWLEIRGKSGCHDEISREDGRVTSIAGTYLGDVESKRNARPFQHPKDDHCQIGIVIETAGHGDALQERDFALDRVDARLLHCPFDGHMLFVVTSCRRRDAGCHRYQ
jgi:hypothetical protein